MGIITHYTSQTDLIITIHLTHFLKKKEKKEKKALTKNNIQSPKIYIP